MSGVILSLFRRSAPSSDWNQQELAEFYRVESALLQGGLSVTTDRGISDEGDPWFVFCRADNEEVIAHFARIAYEYIVVSSFNPGPARGRDFRKLIRDMLDRHPLMLPVKRHSGQKVFLHPSTLLLALLASAYFLSSDKELSGGHGSTSSESRGLLSFLRDKLSIVAALALAVTWLENHTELATKFLDGLPLFHSSDAKTVHVADASHDAALDFLQLVKGLGADKHASLLSHQDSNVPVPQNGDGTQGHDLPVRDANLAVHGSAPGGDAASIALADSPANNNLAGLAGSDNAATAPSGIPSSSVMKAVVALTEHASGGSASSSTGADSLGINSVVLPSDEAVQLTQLTVGGSSAQTVVLSSNPTSIDVALQQAFQQVGFGTDLLHKASLSVTDSATPSFSPLSANTHDSAAVTQNTTSSDSSLASSSAPVQTNTYDSQVEQTISAFLNHTPNFEVAISGANVIIVDTNVADARSPEFGIQIFDMSDGSTLSIVGIVHHSALAVLTA